jgi:cell division septation protein DedD
VTHPAEDGFHEIQLTGKQLVFLFMATTVVAVVIFLCGVLVGRGVRAERAMAEASTAAPQPGTDTPPPAAPVTQSGEPSPATTEDLSYAKRLQGDEPKEHLKPGSASTGAETTAEPPTPAEADAEKPAEKPATRVAEKPAPPPPTARTPASTPTASAPPAGSGWVVQVAALRDRGAAVSIVQRLTRKGFKAFLVEPTRGAPAPGYRVRVGPFQDRGQAEQASRRLEREEQFKPFITR